MANEVALEFAYCVIYEAALSFCSSCLHPHPGSVN